LGIKSPFFSFIIRSGIVPTGVLENRYLTNEEIIIIDYLNNEDIDGLIFCAAGLFVLERIARYEFLPAFFDRTSDGKYHILIKGNF